MDIIEINNLSKTYRNKKWQSVPALKNLNLTIGAGEVFGFLGPNGAGKSTTIKLLMGLIRPSSGSATISGIDSSDAAARLKVGFLPENPAFYDYLTAEEYIHFVASQYGMNSTALANRSSEILQRLGLWEARNRPMRGYSKGMVQRVGLAQSLVHDPDVFVFDEPMSGLDPIGRALVKEIILELKERGKCVFFSTHITDDVEKICDRVGVIFKGELKRVERVDYLVSEGVSAYSIQAVGKDNIVSKVIAERDNLSSVLDEIRASGKEIRLVEPVRKSLEDFFLSIVNPDLNT